jgi:hypothetical protein
MAKPLSLTNKTAILASRFTGSKMRSADTEGEEGGDAGDFEPGRKIRLSEIKVGEAFAAEISKHPGIWRFLFDFGSNNKIKGPASERIGPIRIKEKFKGCRATIAWGIDSKVEVQNARVSNIRLQVDGTECKMVCDLQGLFPMAMETLELEERTGEEVKISIKFGAADDADEAKEPAKQQDFVEEENDGRSLESPTAAPVNGGVPAMGQSTGAKH